MKSLLQATMAMVLICGPAAAACELPTHDSFYREALEEERDLTARALRRSDLVFVGTVRAIQPGPETSSPSDRVSKVEVMIGEVLFGTATSTPVVKVDAMLHHKVVGCFGNESFWDDQVEAGVDYIFFVSAGKIISASPPAASWKKLGLSGQRELVLSLTKGPLRPN